MIKHGLPLALATTLAVLPAAASAGEVSLSGEGIVRYEPDSAKLQFTLTAEHEDAAKASEQVSATMAKWREAIAEYRNKLDDYSDADLNVYTRMVASRTPGQNPERVSVARQTVSFSINDLNLLNPLIHEANKLGLQYHLGSNQFFHSDEQGLEREALARAIADAKNRCDFVAQQLDMRCGEVISLNVNGGHRPVARMMAESKMTADAVSSIGPREIQATVSATFELD